MSSTTLRTTALSIAALGLTVTVSANDEYEFHLVTSFNPSYSLAETALHVINADNVALGTDTFGDFLWNEADGKVQLPFAGVNSLNNLGWVNYGHVLYDPATAVEIAIPAPSSTYYLKTLLDLNDQMVGVGVSSHGGPGCEPFDCTYDCARAFVWDAANGSRHVGPADLKAFHAVNNSNVAVGVIIVNCDDNRGVVYDVDSDQMLVNLSDLLPPLELLGIPAQVWPVDINDAGQVVGLATSGNQPEKPFVWSEADGFTYLPTIPGGEYGYMSVNSINNAGAVVGDALDYDAGRWTSWVWDPINGIRVLEDLVQEPTNFQIENANGINDEGWIVGSGHFGPGWATQKGFVLKPIAPPQLTGDVDLDGVVGVNDLVELVLSWGPCDGCPGDINGDGTIDVSDLVLVVLNWG